MNYVRNYESNKEKMITLYINTVGKHSEEIMQKEIFYNFRCLSSPKVKRTTYGPFKVKKFSFLLTTEDFVRIKNIIKMRMGNNHTDDILILKELSNNNNLYIMDKFDF